MDAQQVAGCPVVLIGPDVVAVGHLAELRAEAQPLAHTMDAALQDIIGAEFHANAAHVHCLAAKADGGNAGDY